MAKIVAFSLPIDLNQLNEVYELYIAGVSREDARTRLDEQISQHLSSKDTIRKTRTILLNVWYDGESSIHDSAVEAARYLTRSERLPAHWAMMLMRFPIFKDLCIVLGNLYELKDCVSAAQIKKEVFNKWGARSTLETSLSKNLKTLRDVGAIKCADKSANYEKCVHTISDPNAVALLFASILLATEQQYMTWESFISHPANFPFSICNVTQADMAAVPYLAMERMGEQVVFRVISPLS
ncbi:hypothetical protein [Syntrophomonas wolfei]|uniref:hypothetical protein n=1 Tax=Syntrophomonas wolfei TaxID=863 RepID=UPI0007733D06|nr:hypothetical protein [Syntrophomonas wolfei]